METPPDPGTIHLSNPGSLTSDTYCGLCGNDGPLKKTDCCNRTICDTPEKGFKGDILSICSRNHREYTLCGLHHAQHHDASDWRGCSQCKEQLTVLEKYVGYGTNRYNFQGDRWENPPTVEPKTCAQCGVLLRPNIESVICRPDGRWICPKHCQIPESMARAMLSRGNYKVESFGIS